MKQWCLTTSFLLAMLFGLCCYSCAKNQQPKIQGQGTGTSSSQTGYQLGGQTPGDLITSVPLLPLSTGSKPGFTYLGPEHTGITFENLAVDSNQTPIQLSAQPGLASADFDGDGDLDLFLCGLGIGNKLYRNEGNMTFSDITGKASEMLAAESDLPSGAIFFDVEGDGDKDLYVCNRNSANKLYINDGNGQFTEEAADRGAASEYSTIMTTVFDADQDGDLDMYLCNYRLNRNNVASPEADEKFQKLKAKYEGKQVKLEIDPDTGNIELPGELAEDFSSNVHGFIQPKPHPDQLLINDGSGNFTDGAEAAGLLKRGWSLQALACDFNNDGLTDLMVSGDFNTPDYYYLNNGDGTFTDHAKEMLRTTSYFSMGSDAGDLNGDGLMDIFVGDMASRNYKDGKRQSGDMNEFRWELINLKPQQNMRNALYLNRGGGWMTEIAQLAGVKSSDWTWSCRIVDLNCSGIPEIFATNGYISKAIEVDNRFTIAAMKQLGRTKEEIQAFRDTLDPWLTDNAIFTAQEHLKYSKAPDNWGMHDNSIGTGASVADYDGDGDLDIIINNTNAQAGVWRNDLEVGNRVLIDLRQTGPNPEAVSARVWAYCGDDLFTQDVILARGFAAGESSRMHFGLGNHDKIDRLVIRWPDGKLQTVEGLAANHLYTIRRAENLPDWVAKNPAPLFAQTDLAWEQKELDTVEAEYNAEPLLPIQRSMLGTGAGIADFNADGHLDVYLAGPSGQTGQLMAGDGQGGFSPSPELEGKIPAEVEEMGVLWFDANGDNLPDLYITCGGIEQPFGDKLTRDRLFINTGTGFSESLLPQLYLPTGAVAAADIDGDGDLDLAVCSRAYPGAFMKTAPSTILENDGEGNFSENLALAPGFESAGVISDAQFADLNNDGLPDLVLAVEFGTIQIWVNQDGKLVKGSASPSGMWNSLGIADFDNDGDLDILAGNWGLNTKYHPKAEKPYTVVCDDFDNNGTRDVVEVKYGGGGLLPGRGRSCSGYAIDYIPQKWPTWTEFSNASFEEIYGPISQVAERFDAETVNTMLLVNDGSGNFEAGELPLAAQYSPVFGVAIGDFNLDGNLDICLANNFTGPQPEAGRWINGYGLVLLGNGDCSFIALEPPVSGLSMYEDGRGAIAGDFTGDGLLDVLMSASNAAPKLITAQASAGGQGSSLLVNVTGQAPNTAAVGARLTLHLDSGGKLTREIRAGSGYLSSYSGPVHFGIPAEATPTKLEIKWPDGTSITLDDVSTGTLEVEQE